MEEVIQEVFWEGVVDDQLVNGEGQRLLTQAGLLLLQRRAAAFPIGRG